MSYPDSKRQKTAETQTARIIPIGPAMIPPNLLPGLDTKIDGTPAHSFRLTRPPRNGRDIDEAIEKALKRTGSSVVILQWYGSDNGVWGVLITRDSDIDARRLAINASSTACPRARMVAGVETAPGRTKIEPAWSAKKCTFQVKDCSMMGVLF